MISKNPSIVKKFLILTIIESLNLRMNSKLTICPLNTENQIFEFGEMVVFGKKDVNYDLYFPASKKNGAHEFYILYNEGNKIFIIVRNE